MRVRWAFAARQDRADIVSHIGGDNPVAAARMDRLFSDSAKGLGAYPRIGRPGIVPGTLEIFPHENYRMVYEVEGGVVWILALVHVARRWPPLPNDEPEG